MTSLAKNPFEAFQPVLFNFEDDHSLAGQSLPYTVKRNHGIKTSFLLHNPNDEINENRPYLEKVIIEYRIKSISYDLFTIGDFLSVSYPFEERTAGTVIGDIAERIARRITKYFLKHFSFDGRTGGIFDKRFNPSARDNFLVGHTDNYVLKILRYPNMVILKKTGGGKYGYENIKELDGLFDYRWGSQRHILVLESKLDKINVNSDDLITNCFRPLRALFPSSRFSYILFSDAHSLFRSKGSSPLRRLRHVPLTIFHKLKNHDIDVLYFTFNETRDDFERIKNHLIMQYRFVNSLDMHYYGKIILSDKKIVLFDGGETPRIKLIKDVGSGMWKEIKLRHKSKSKPRNNG
ncbi:MAG: hypothetical protein JW795_12255 [Chitinivibrionales bacterium]|nr:hypothetical protein [Chitinivibrionales bacterium]